MKRKQKINFRIYLRAIVTLGLLSAWSLVTFTGFLMLDQLSRRSLAVVARIKLI